MGCKAKLLFFCGKMAAGKSTLSRELAEREHAVLLVQDEFLERLFPGEIVDIPGYLKYSSRLRDALGPHICALLCIGISVVLDFRGNTRSQRAWFRQLFEASGADHELHFIDAKDDVCKRQLKERSKGLPAGTAWTTDAEFDAITVYLSRPRSKNSSTSFGMNGANNRLQATSLPLRFRRSSRAAAISLEDDSSSMANTVLWWARQRGALATNCNHVV